jgi:hypothetical protein
MLNVRGIVTGGIVVLLVGLLASCAKSDLDTKSAKLFKTSWASLKYSSKAVANSPDAPSTTGQKWVWQQDQEHFRLSAEIEFPDPNWVLGTCRNGVITRLVDGAGRDVNVPPTPSSPRRDYEFPCYGRWLEPPARGTRPQAVDQLQPNSVGFTLDVGPLKQAGGEIRRVEGYFYAVIPESMESIDVPFRPDSAWVRLTPDFEIQVLGSEMFAAGA